MDQPLTWTIQLDEADPETTLLRGMVRLITTFETAGRDAPDPIDQWIRRDQTLRVLKYIMDRFPPIEP